jgi:two-component system, chemotaxis family, sensor kinase CheA
MSLDMSQFHESFFEESFEASDAMEAALLKLGVGVPDHEGINTIFRGAHSIKGGAAMLGFSELTSFTHTLETLLDALRSGKMEVTAAILDSLLKSVDVLREMMRAAKTKAPVDAQRVADLQFDLEAAVVQGNNTPAPAQPAAPQPVVAIPQVQAVASEKASSAAAEKPATPAGQPAAAGKTVGAAAPTQTGWDISFKPLPHLLVQGNDPLAIFAALAEIGPVQVVADMTALPAVGEMDPQLCYLSWQLQLASDCGREQVEEAFDWAAGDCDLHIEPATAVQPAGPTKAAAGPAAVVQPVDVEPTKVAAAGPAAVAEPVDVELTKVAAVAGPAKAARADSAKSAASDSSSIRVSTDKVDELINTVGELVITQAMLTELGRLLEGAGADELRGGLVQLERHMRQLQESVMRVRMLPISVAFSRFPRLVHDLAQRLGKKIELKLSGEQTELDKTVLEKIGDPLVHLVRNSIDHGIESPEARLAAGKTDFGTIHLSAYHRGGNIAVEIQDDGAGLDRDRILAKARSKGLVGANDSPTNEQINELIFLPGFSTADKTTEVSGRGVGMDVVRQRVKELGGTVEIRTERGKGSRFLITLPLTLAIVDGQSVVVGTESYIVPLTSIIESLQLKGEQVSRLAGRGEVFSFREEYLPIVRLCDVFGIEPRSRSIEDGLVVVAEGDGKRIGLLVDELLGQQQVVIKSMEANYGRVEGVAGATILGDGSVALILDLAGLIHCAAMRSAA